MSAPSAPESSADSGENTVSSPVSEARRRELRLYVAVSVAAVELLIYVGCMCYGFIAAAGPGGRFSFPWIIWAALSAALPAAILLAVHLADVGLFRVPHGAAGYDEWQNRLPERMQRLYRIIKGAPVLVVLVGIIVLGAALLTVEGVLSGLSEFAAALVPYLPYIAGGAAAVVCVGILAAAWVSVRTRRLREEYDFRREVLEKTGVIIVDRDSTALPSGGEGEIPYRTAIAGENGLSALPPGENAGDGPTFDAEASEKRN